MRLRTPASVLSRTADDAGGRVNPATYENDPHLEQLIAVAPFGLSSTPPAHTTDVVKGVRSGVAVDDKLLIWGGGLYNWFDPLTLITAVARLAERRPAVRLLFLGTKHPGVDEMGIVRESFDLARELGRSTPRCSSTSHGCSMLIGRAGSWRPTRA